MARVTEEDVYNTLSYAIWKSPMEIREELEEKRDLKMGVALTYQHLDSIVNHGLAERQQRTQEKIDPQRLGARDGRPEWEYHLTPKGVTNRDFYDKPGFGLVDKVRTA